MSQSQEEHPSPAERPLQQMNVLNVQNMLGNIPTAPPISVLQQSTITNLTGTIIQLRTELAQTQAERDRLRDELSHLQETVKQMKLDMKILLLKVKYQDKPSQNSNDDCDGGAGVA